MQQQLQLTVEESLNFSKETSFWDGFAAGARAAAEHAKQSAIQRIVESRRVPAPVTAPAKKEK